MTIMLPIWCEIVCNSCAATTAGRYTFGAVPRREMKEDAYKAGWLVRESEFYCSEECAPSKN